MASWMVPSISTMICSTVILLLTCVYLYRVERKKFLFIWFVSWSINTVAQVLTLVMVSGAGNNLIADISYALFLISALKLIEGAYNYLGKQMPWWWCVSIALCIIWLPISNELKLPFLMTMFPTTIALGLGTVWVGIIFLYYGEGQRNLRFILGSSFILWGLHKMDYPLMRNLSWFAPWGYVISAIFILIITIVFIFMYFERIREELVSVQNTLISNEKRLVTIIQNQRDIIFELNKAGCFTYVSPACLEVTGYSVQETIGQSFIKLVGNEVWEQIISCNSEGCNFERTWINKEQSTIYLNIYCRPNINAVGEFEGVIGSIHDVTENKLLDEAIEYDKLKNEFFANISHELRTPLNVIHASTQLLDLYNESNESEEFKAKVDKSSSTIKQNIFRLSRLINNIIDITKVDAGFFDLQIGNYNIISVVEEITLSVVDYIQNKGISLEFDTEVEEKIIACDADKIERVMLNILSNAAKFTEKGGIIKVNIVDGEQYITIHVRDTGIGIPKDKQGIIFERFRQVDKSLSRKNEGSGIGLSLVKSLVELHGGSVKVVSDYGMGSEFIISLPIRRLESENIGERLESYGGRKIDIEFSDILS